MPVHLLRLIPWLRNRRAGLMLVACGIAIGLTVAASTALLVVAGRRAAIGNAERELRNTAYILAEETDRRLQAIDLVQTNLINALRADGVDTPEALAQITALPSTASDLRRRIADLPEIGFLAIADRDGVVQTSTSGGPVPDSQAMTDDILRPLAEDTTRDWLLSTPIRDVAHGSWNLILARRFTGFAGQPIGIVCVSLHLRSFETFFASLVMRPQSSIALFGADGVLLARFPPLDASIGRSTDVAARYRAAIAGSGNRIVHRASVLDGVDRLIAPQGVRHYPLMMSATTTLASALSDWRLLARWMIGGTVLTELILAAVTAMAVRQLRHQDRLGAAYAAQLEAEAGRAVAESELARARDREHHQRQAELEALRLDTALSNMHQGLLMFDDDHRLQLVNGRFAQICGMPPGTLHAGMPFTAFVQAIRTNGNVPQDDIDLILSRRAQMVRQAIPDSFIWEVSDGRVFSVSYRPVNNGWISTYEDITERRRLDARMAHMARCDLLTDLPNRVGLRERLDVALGFARRGQPVALLCLDLDAFKTVNDTLGHPVGDCLLQAVAERLRTQVCETEAIARLGSDEFAVIQTGLDKPADATAFAEHLLRLLAVPFMVNGHEIVIEASLGIAFAPQDGSDPDTLLKNAELALHRAKQEERGTCRLFHAGMDAELQARRGLEVELRAALSGHQLELFYQPLVDVRAADITGFEALVRWRHPVKGMVPPTQFIPLAEEIGLIVPIGAWVLREACATAAGWDDSVHVAVNLSPAQFKSRHLVATVVDALKSSGLPPERLELEITETVILHDTTETLATLRALKALGVRIALDDFGTGFSSLSYLRRFPFDRIKIDQSFVRELGSQRDCNAIVRAVVGLSRDLGIAATAEGVETHEQLRLLRLAGCCTFQGYLFSPPVPVEKVPGLLQRAEEWSRLLMPSLAA